MNDVPSDLATNNAEQGERPEGRREWPEAVSSAIVINKRPSLDLVNIFLSILAFSTENFLFPRI